VTQNAAQVDWSRVGIVVNGDFNIDSRQPLYRELRAAFGRARDLGRQVTITIT
jgi:nucleoside phosphorylase